MIAPGSEQDSSGDFIASLPVGKLTIWAIVGVVALWAALGFGALVWEDPGRFGDMFGAATSLFTGLAFAGVIITVLLQSKELSLQREELRDTRAELAAQKEQLQLQARTMQRQADDQNFFQLLSLFRNMARQMRHPGQPEEGVEYWRRLVKICHQDISFHLGRQPNGGIDQVWADFFRGWEPTLGPYFSTLAELLALIAAGDAEAQERWSRILRSQIPAHELVLIFYHARSPWGVTMLKGYIEEFHLFRYFPDGDDYLENKCRDWYDPAAFSDGQ